MAEAQEEPQAVPAEEPEQEQAVDQPTEAAVPPQEEVAVPPPEEAKTEPEAVVDVEEEKKQEIVDPPHFPPDAVPAELKNWDDLTFKSAEELKHIKDFEIGLSEKSKFINVPPQFLARFLLGSKMRPPTAERKFLDMVKLCRKYKFDTISREKLKECFIEMGKSMSFGGVDKEGHPVFVISYSKFFPDKFEFAPMVKAFIIILDMLTQNLDVSREGISFVADMKSFGWSNFSVDLEKLFITIFQDIYPLRTKAMYMVEAPMLINVVMKIIKPFLSRKMKDRLHIIDRTALLEKVDANQLPPLIGGLWQTSEKFADQCCRFLDAFGDNPLYFDTTTAGVEQLEKAVDNLAVAVEEHVQHEDELEQKRQVTLENLSASVPEPVPKVAPEPETEEEKKVREAVDKLAESAPDMIVPQPEGNIKKALDSLAGEAALAPEPEGKIKDVLDDMAQTASQGPKPVEAPDAPPDAPLNPPDEEPVPEQEEAAEEAAQEEEEEVIQTENEPVEVPPQE